MIVANELLAQGIDRYEYEQELKLASGAVRYPDFTIENDDTGEVFYWEHLGMLHNPEYFRRWQRKLQDYEASGILPREKGGGPNGTLIVTMDNDVGGIDSSEISEFVSEIVSG